MPATIYLTAGFLPISVSTTKPGDVHIDPRNGECRRVTARRICLLAERVGKDSDAVTRLLNAIAENAVDGQYDGRPLESWYGLIGLQYEPQRDDGMAWRKCPKCGCQHFGGGSEMLDLCFLCWFGPGLQIKTMGPS